MNAPESEHDHYHAPWVGRLIPPLHAVAKGSRKTLCGREIVAGWCRLNGYRLDCKTCKRILAKAVKP